ncbi:MAG TPA: CHASE3 domain-containing protein, partial [Acidimicrobiia bacterium]|nr:CHASE3 domain-containing protein [Acidimicrobiia bacterium]
MQTIRAKMILALIVPVVVLVPVTVITVSATQTTHRASEAVRRSADLLQGAQRLLLAAVDSETGVRGFIVTGDDRFLEPWNNGRAAFDAEVAALRRNLTGESEQLARLDRMAALEQQWRTQVAEPQIASVRAKTPDAVSIAKAGTGKAVKDQVRVATSEFVAAERARFEEHIASNQRAVDRARLASLVGPALAGIILLMLVLALARNIAGRLANLA